jgi:general secretion pathway protein A
MNPVLAAHADAMQEGAGVPDLEGLLSVPAFEHKSASEEARPAPAHAHDFLAFHRLSTNPFSDSVNPVFFYRTDAHDVAFIRMMMVIEHDISLGLITGFSGTGKTLVSQMLLRNLDPARYEPVLVLVCPNMGKTALLREILSELGIAIPRPPVATQDMLKLLSDAIINLHNNGRKLVILIDECHFLSAESLHLIRTISNIEIPERKLSTCILFGEQRFLKRLSNPSYESLRNRMYLRSELKPLEPNETDQYIKFRLLVSGREEMLFDASAVAAIQSVAGGVCRRINRICMLALVQAFSEGKSVIDEAIITTCAKDF